MTTHQFSLFGFQRPKSKVPISKERIEEVKRLISKGNSGDAVAKLREIREGLENFERRINHKRDDETRLDH
jgi:hypothetical protein